MRPLSKEELQEEATRISGTLECTDDLSMVRQTIGILKSGKQVILEMDAAEEEHLFMLRDSIARTHAVHYERGWWTQLVKEFNYNQDLRVDYLAGERPTGSKAIGEIVSLIHSEVSEAYEAHRTNKHDDKLPEFLGIEVELADAVIRIFDAAKGLNLRVAEAMVHKLKYNGIREDHSHAARSEANGKKS